MTVEENNESKKSDQDKALRHRVMGGMLFTSVIFSVIVGLAVSNLSWYFSIPVCIFGGAVGMFFGMAIEWIRFRGETEDLKGQLVLERMSGEMRIRRRVAEAVGETKKECGGFAIESAKAVANRVANRIIARHAGSLLNDEQREATLEETDQIVEEELGAFREAIRDESEDVKKS